MPPRVTLAQVAAEAGVSVAAASKALNAREDVAERTREAVEDAAARLGYRRRHTAPAAGDTLRVSVTFDEIGNEYSAAVLEGMIGEACVQSAQISVTQAGCVRGGVPAGSPEWIRSSPAGSIDAFILVTTPVTAEHVRAAADLGRPLVVVDPTNRPPSAVRSVGATNWRGAVEATDHLIALGHRRIAFVGHPRTSVPGNERLAGYHHALDRAGLPRRSDFVLPGGYHHEDGAAAFRRMNALADPPTAYVAAADTVAVGVVSAALRVGLRVPHDVSVVGFDDVPSASWSAPALTTVRQPLGEMGRIALRITASLVRPGQALPDVEIGTRLIVRETTASPPAG